MCLLFLGYVNSTGSLDFLGVVSRPPAESVSILADNLGILAGDF